MVDIPIVKDQRLYWHPLLVSERFLSHTLQGSVKAVTCRRPCYTFELPDHGMKHERSLRVASVSVSMRELV
jgi:hypothetical protein